MSISIIFSILHRPPFEKPLETTVTRCKEIRPLAEKMITLGKKGDLAAYRQAMAFVTREESDPPPC